MKEFSIEEKAEAYDNVVDKLRRFLAQGVDPLITRADVQDFFPELKESKDEKIRKALIDFFKDAKQGLELQERDNNQWQIEQFEIFIDWLEKQGQTFTKKDVDDAYLKGVCDAKQELEKQGEQLIDKVEPKFREGDWITHNTANFVFKVINVGSNGYEVVNRENNKKTILFDNENNYHLWTIQDAKDGDVLVSGQITILFKKFEEDSDCNFVIAYAGIDISGNLQITDKHWLISNDAKPATKEQRDTLERAMTNAGYTFDFEKLELKKIEQNPAEWSEDDKYTIECLIDYLETELDNSYLDKDKEAFAEQIKLLKSLKDRILPQPKQEWSEEDKKLIDDTCHLINTLASGYGEKVTEPITFSGTQMIASIKDRLRALVEPRPQNHWQPSDEQMDALRYVFQHYLPTPTDTLAWDALKTIELMLDQLKELREE